jgi:hypothetical protein
MHILSNQKKPFLGKMEVSSNHFKEGFFYTF